jgi:RNA polymerase-associated protein
LPAERAEIKERLHYLYDHPCSYADELLRSKKRPAAATKALQLLNSEISNLRLYFSGQAEWCLSSHFSLLDCCIAPLLWRLSAIDMPIRQSAQTKPLLDYMRRIFERDDFLGCMTQGERGMR